MKKQFILVCMASLLAACGCSSEWEFQVTPDSDTSYTTPSTTPDPGTQEPVPGTQEPDPGTQEPDPGTQEPDPGTQEPDPGTQEPDPGTQEPDPGTQEPDPPKCEDTCSGGPECLDDHTFRTCKDNGSGCKEWVSTACGNDMVCQNGACETQAPSCKDTCSGGTECVDKHTFRTCKDNGSGCKEWVSTACNAGTVCEAGVCETEKPTCTDECNSGTECVGTNAYRTCVQGSDGCKKWSTTNCKSSEECENGKCIVPIPPCADTCDKPTRCDGKTGYQQCKDTDNDGCKEWTTTTKCPSGQECQNGTCVTPQPTCTNACASGATQCSGKVLQTCKDSNNDGCTEWVTSKTCDYKCESGKCITDPNAWVPACSGSYCPTVITDFSKTYSGDTKQGQNKISTYAGKCSNSSEAGPEQSYILKVNESGYLIAGITEPSGGDVDVHILSGLTASSCLARSDKGAIARVSAGIYYVIVDTFSSASNAGAYKLKVTFIADSSKCAMNATSMPRLYGGSTLSLPTAGKVVQEAHLVTTNDKSVNGSSWWPNSYTQGLSAHKAYTDKLFGSGTSSGNEWCPSGEGGCQYGQGCTGKAVPPKAEAWYLNMAWKSRPTAGARYLVVNPVNGKAVVTAAGYETGPGDTSNIGGVVYEVHHYLGTGHKSNLTIGEMKNQTLDWGPIDCSK